MGGDCNTHMESEIHTKIWSENLKGMDHLENLDVGKVCKGWN